MEPLFEAKVNYNRRYAYYNIYRLEADKYKAQLIVNEDSVDTGAPKELTMSKNNNTWHSDDKNCNDLCSTLGAEIDVFNNGYGALLGRIGVR